MDDDSKPWWASKTIWMALGVIIVAVGRLFGADLSEEDAAQIGGWLGDIALIAFGASIIWSRINAKKKID